MCLFAQAVLMVATIAAGSSPMMLRGLTRLRAFNSTKMNLTGSRSILRSFGSSLALQYSLPRRGLKRVAARPLTGFPYWRCSQAADAASLQR